MIQKILRLTLFGVGLLLVRSSSAAESEAPSTGTLCWYHPKNTGSQDKLRLTTAMTDAMAQTKPAHVDYKLERVKSKSHAATLSCIVIIDVTKKPQYKSTKEIMFEVKKADASESLIQQTLVLDLRKVEVGQLVPLWTEVWSKVAPPAPPPPPPPAPPPVAETPFVDEELKAAQAAEAQGEPDGPPRGRFLSLFAGFGLSTRSLGEAAPGRPLEQGGALSIGLDAVLHTAELLRLSEHHDLDADIGYQLRFLNAPDEESVGVSADRFNVGGAYRYQLPGAYLPRVGVLAGFELLRNELSGGEGAYSVRYSVLRAGLTVAESIPIDEQMSLRAFLDFALRLAPGAEGADTSPSLDVGGGVALRWERFLVRTRLRYAQHSVEANSVSFGDGFFDLDLALGFQL